MTFLAGVDNWCGKLRYATPLKTEGAGISWSQRIRRWHSIEPIANILPCFGECTFNVAEVRYLEIGEYLRFWCWFTLNISVMPNNAVPIKLIMGGCWINMYDVGTTFSDDWGNMSTLLGLLQVLWKVYIFLKQVMF